MSSMLIEINRYYKLATFDYKSKYAGSRLGLFWMPLSTVFIVAMLMAVFSTDDVSTLIGFMSYLTIGLITWSFISDGLAQGGNLFRTKRVEFESSEESMLSVFIRALVYRSYRFLFELAVLCFMYILPVFEVPLHLLMLPVALGLLMLLSLYLSIVLSIVMLYIPDVEKLLSFVIRGMFFATPVFWGYGGTSSGAQGVLYYYNPFTYFLELMRFSIGLESVISLQKLLVICGLTTLFTYILATWMMARLPQHYKCIQ